MKAQITVCWSAFILISCILIWGGYTYIPQHFSEPAKTIDYPADKQPTLIPVIRKNRRLKQKGDQTNANN